MPMVAARRKLSLSTISRLWSIAGRDRHARTDPCPKPPAWQRKNMPAVNRQMLRRFSAAVANSRGPLCHDAPCPLRRDQLRPVTASPGGRAPQLSKNIRCLSNMRRLPSSASSSESATSERWPVSSARLTITRWQAIWTANSAICRLACARYFWAWFMARTPARSVLLN